MKATAATIARQFSHDADISLSGPVIVTKNGRERNVILSIDEYHRLLKRDRVALLTEDTPAAFLHAIDDLIHDLDDRAPG